MAETKKLVPAYGRSESEIQKISQRIDERVSRESREFRSYEKAVSFNCRRSTGKRR